MIRRHWDKVAMVLAMAAVWYAVYAGALPGQ